MKKKSNKWHHDFFDDLREQLDALPLPDAQISGLLGSSSVLRDYLTAVTGLGPIERFHDELARLSRQFSGVQEDLVGWENLAQQLLPVNVESQLTPSLSRTRRVLDQLSESTSPLHPHQGWFGAFSGFRPQDLSQGLMREAAGRHLFAIEDVGIRSDLMAALDSLNTHVIEPKSLAAIRDSTMAFEHEFQALVGQWKANPVELLEVPPAVS